MDFDTRLKLLSYTNLTCAEVCSSFASGRMFIPGLQVLSDRGQSDCTCPVVESDTESRLRLPRQGFHQDTPYNFPPDTCEKRPTFPVDFPEYDQAYGIFTLLAQGTTSSIASSTSRLALLIALYDRAHNVNTLLPRLARLHLLAS